MNAQYEAARQALAERLYKQDEEYIAVVESALAEIEIGPSLILSRRETTAAMLRGEMLFWRCLSPECQLPYPKRRHFGVWIGGLEGYAVRNKSVTEAVQIARLDHEVMLWGWGVKCPNRSAKAFGIRWRESRIDRSKRSVDARWLIQRFGGTV